MAKLNQCRVCSRTVVNSYIHPECRVAELEDLLFRIQKHLKSHPEQHLSKKLTGEVMKACPVPISEFHKQEAKKVREACARELLGLQRLAVANHALERFDKKHPDKTVVY
jgi:hypothetical protein